MALRDHPFKTVAVPLEVHPKLHRLALLNRRSMAQHLALLIEESYGEAMKKVRKKNLGIRLPNEELEEAG